VEELHTKRRVVNGRKVGCLVILVLAILAAMFWLRSKRSSDTNLQENPAVHIEAKKTPFALAVC
jgi:flagellar basal body-associated protein FliL